MVDRNPSAVYFDTSALLKLYVQERWTEVAERAADEAEVLLVSEISYLEARAAFARMREDRALQCDVDLLRAAGALAEKHRRKRLRSYDALHLASALDAFVNYGPAEGSGPEWTTLFLAFDRNLVKASRGEVDPYFEPFAEPEVNEDDRKEPAGDVDSEA